MFGINEKYRINKKIALTNVIPKELKADHKKHLREVLKKVVLALQIKGEEIPSRMDEENNCQVIMFLDIQITNIKEARFVGEILQREIKPLCIIHFYDEQEESYHLAEKRLHAIEKNQVVVESIVSTLPQSLYFGGELTDMMEDLLDIDKMINKQDKLTLYRELLVKSYLLNTSTLKQELHRFFNSKVWYNTEQVMEVYHHLRQIDVLKARKVYTDKDKANLNIDIKAHIDQINKLL